MSRDPASRSLSMALEPDPRTVTTVNAVGITEAFAAALANTAEKMAGNRTDAAALLADAIRLLTAGTTIDGQPQPVTQAAAALSDVLRAPIGDYEGERDAWNRLEDAAQRGWQMSMEAEEADCDARAIVRDLRDWRDV